MNQKPLANVRVTILSTNDFEQSEMTEPRKALDEAGASTTLIAPRPGKLQAMKHDVKADYFDVDLTLDRANPNDFDAVVLSWRSAERRCSASRTKGPTFCPADE